MGKKRVMKIKKYENIDKGTVDIESHREMIALEKRTRREHFVSDFVKKREQDYLFQIELEKSRQRLQQEEDLKREAEELALIEEKRQEEEKLDKQKKDLELKKKHEQQQNHYVRLLEEKRERETCPFYRDLISKTLQNSINSSRLQEIQLRKEILNRRPEALLNKCRLRR